MTNLEICRSEDDKSLEVVLDMKEGQSMARCEVCGNDYDKSFEVILEGRTHVFDCFECAIHALAPSCAHCSCRIIGHGSEAGGDMFCCAHCAKAEGVAGVDDRAPGPVG